MTQHVADTTALDDPAGVHHRDVVRYLCGHADVMSHKNNPHPEFFL
jgi:hypothetical protein